MNRRRTRYRFELVLVSLITVLFGVTTAIILYAKWVNFDPYMLDFAGASRAYEKLLEGIPFSFKMNYYMMFYMGLYPIFFLLYALFPSGLFVFVVHLVSFSIAIPILYLIARQILPGVLLPLAVIIAYVLNPTVDFMAIAFLRQEAVWMVLFLLSVYFEGKRMYDAAVVTAIGACIVRVDAAPAIFLLGLLYVIQRKSRLGIKIMRGSALVMAIMITGLIVFRIASGIPIDLSKFYIATIMSSEGQSLWDTVVKVVRTIMSPSSYLHFTILLQFLLLPLLAPSYLLPGLSSAAYIVLSSESYRSIPLVSSLITPGNLLVPYLDLHDSYMLPILFVAMIHGIRKSHDWLIRWRRLDDRFKAWFRTAYAVVLMILFFVVHWFFATPELGPIPLTSHFDLDHYRPTYHSRIAWKALFRTPRDQPGLMQFSFAQRAPKHPLLTEIYHCTEVEPDTKYALFDLYALSPNMSRVDLLEKIRAIVLRDDFRVDYFEDGIVLLVRGQADERNGQVLTFIKEKREELLRGKFLGQK